MKNSQVVMGNIIGQFAAVLISPFFNGTTVKTTTFNGFKKIADIFPDTVLAENIANHLRKKIDDEILCEELYLIKRFFQDGKKAAIHDFSGLEYLGGLEIIRVVSHKQLLHIPKQLQALYALQVVEFSDGILQEIPEWLFLLPRLKKLNLAKQKINLFTDKMCEKTQIIYLNLADNEIATLPKTIGQLKHLKYFNVSGNPITTIPIELMYLKQLVSLDFSGTKIEQLPICLANISTLKELKIKQTNIKKIDGLLYQKSNADLRIYQDTAVEVRTYNKEHYEKPKGMFPTAVLMAVGTMLGVASIGFRTYQKTKMKARFIDKNRVMKKEE